MHLALFGFVLIIIALPNHSECSYDLLASGKDEVA